MYQMQNPMNDQAVAADLLLSAKAGVKNCAAALTEAHSVNVRKALNQQLQQAVMFHQQVADYMVSKGYYEPYNLEEQIAMDQQATDMALQNSQDTPGSQMQ
jgi:similar to spore coat protein